MITFPLPKESLIIGADMSFSASFNTLGDGKYSFTTSANSKKTILDLQANCLYFIDNMSVAGDIPSEDFVGALNGFCYLQLFRKQSDQQVYKTALPISMYTDVKPLTAWLNTDKGNDVLQGTFTGSLNQTSNLIGVSTISILISLSLYAINDTNYINAWKKRTEINPNMRAF